MNYLELTNEAIQEAGANLARLTSVEFASPPQEMQARFKSWVARAWNDLQASREGWSFLSGRGSGVLNPRIYVTNGNLPAEPLPGHLFEGTIGRTVLQVSRCITTEGSWSAGTAKAFLEVANLDDNLLVGERFNRITAPGGLDAFTFAGRGRWSLSDISPDIDDLNYHSIYVANSSTAGRSVQLKFLEWNLWNDFREGSFSTASHPVEFTETPDRLLDFHPAPERPVRLHFNYEKKHSRLVLDTDAPELDEQYHSILVWMAVLSYARWDEKPGVARDAERQLRMWRTRVENKFLPKLGWGTNAFYG